MTAPRPVGSSAAREVRCGSCGQHAVIDALRDLLDATKRCRDSFGDTLANIRDMTEHVNAAPLAAAAVLDAQDYVPWGRVARLEAEVERLGTLLALARKHHLRDAKAADR